MSSQKIILFSAIFCLNYAHADTPPPGAVKAKMFSGDGVTAIGAVGDALKQKVVSSTSDPVFNAVVFGGAAIDPRNIRALNSMADSMACAQSGAWNVNVTGGTVSISGVATEATLATLAKESGGNLETIADETAATRAAVEALNAKVTAVNTGAVTVSSSALPTGAATQATLATRASEATLATRSSETTAAAAAASVAAINKKITTTPNGILVDVGSASFTASSDVNDGAGNPITSTVDGGKRRLDVAIQSPLSIEGGNASAVKVDGSAVTQPVSAASLPLPTGAATQTTLAAINTKIVTTANGITVDGSGVTQPVSVSSLPLPAGAATEATLASRASESTAQTTRDRVTDINNKLNSLGQKTTAGSVPVTMASDQSAIPVSGTVSVSGVATETSLADLNSKVKAYDLDTSGTNEFVTGVSLRLPTSSGSVPAGTATVPLRTDPTGTTTQPVSIVGGMINLPAGSATEAKQDVGNASLANIDSDIDVALSSRATEATVSALNTKVPSGLTVNVNKLLVDNSGQTQPVSAASLPLPAGAATAANQATGNGFLSSIDGKVVHVDTGAVVVASSALPAGASTEATLATRATETTLATRATEATLATRASESTLSSLNGKILNVDLDTGAGNQAAQGVNLRFAGNGGSVEAGTASSPLRVDPTGTTTQPVSIVGSALPAGAATEATLLTRASEATLAALNAKVTAVDTGNVVVSSSALPSGASTAANQTTGNASLSSIDGKITAVNTNSVTVVSSALPTGAATAANQATANGSLSSLDGKTRSYDVDSGAGTENTQGVVLRKSASGGSVELGTSSDPVRTDPTGATIQPVSGTVGATQSGTWNVNNVTGTVSLPTGASTAANQATANASLSAIQTSTANIDGKLNSLGQKTMSASAPVAIASDQSAIPSSQSGTWNITNVSGTVSLPTGAATAANQTTANSSLSAIQTSTASVDTKTPTVGQKTSAASSPVVLASDQPALPVTQSGAWSQRLQDGSGNAVTSQVNGAQRALDVGVNVAGVQVDPRAVRALTSADVVTAQQGGTWNITNVSGTVSLPTGASTATLQTSGNASLTSIDGKLNSLGQKAMAASAPVVISSDQSAIPASQSGTWNINNVSGTVSLPTGAATSAAQTTGNASLSSLDGKFNTLGQKLSAASVPVVLSSDQSAVPASQSGTWNINNVSGTVSLPTGASTAANQTTGNASVASIDGKLNSLGQKASTASAPVVLASDQSAIPASQSGTWNVNNVTGTVSLPTGAATSALQTSGNASLTSIDAKTAALGQTSTLASASPIVQPGDLAVAAQNVTTQDLVTASTAQAYGQTVLTGTPTVGSAAAFTSSGYQNGVIVIKGTWIGTLVVETSQDGGTSWVAHTTRLIGGSIFQSTFTANAQVSINLANKTNVRVRASAAMTGTAVVTINQGFNEEAVYVANSLRIADGSNTTVQTPLTIKAASTSPTSADTAAVVTISPNRADLTEAAPVASTVGVASAQAVAANANRAGLEIVNTSNNRISCALGFTAVLNSGITLFPGGTWQMNEFNFSTAALNCIAGAASSNLSIEEYSK